MRDEQLWFVGPNAVEIRGVSVPLEVPDGMVRLAGEVSGISRGTELLLYRGEGPRPFDESMGVDGPPCRYGYAWVGRVERASSADGAPAEGSRVFALLPHGSIHTVPVSSFRAIPAGLSSKRATLLANAETAITLAWDAELAFGDEVVVFGAGVVGLLTAAACERSGARVVLVEPSDARRALAERLGFRTTVDAPAGHDVAIEVSGRPEVLSSALSSVRREGRVVVGSYYGTKPVQLSLGARFHRDRVRILSSQVSSVPARLSPRWDYARRFELAIDLATDERWEALLKATYPFRDASKVYAKLASGLDETPHVCFEYER